MNRQRPFWLTNAFYSSLTLGVLACASPAAQAPGSTPAPASAATPPQGPSTETTTAIASFLATPAPDLNVSKEEREILGRIYPPSGEQPLWVDAKLRPTKSATDALTAFSEAATEGLDYRDYGGEALAALGKTLTAGSASTPAEAARFDVSLSLSMARYLRHFHRGRVKPGDIGFLMTLPPDEHDHAVLVRDAATQGRVKETITSMAPPLVQYRALRAMLPRYRELAQDATLAAFPTPPAKAIKPGGRAPSLDLVRTLLVAVGDLPAGTAPPADPTLYEGELVEGVKRFQTRHGIVADGVLGKTTWKELGVPMSWRLRQIELAMERMRWLPHLGERAFVAVNIPMFRLWGWDSVPETGMPDFEMGVIVGKALNTRTPVFLEEMKHLIFQPYWNVPKSILQKEILPILRRNLGYLHKEDMEIVDGQGDNAKVVAPSSDALDRLAAGKLRLRQRPGPKNALGQVKFMFPNDENVYLHSTPAPELFDRTRRDFSHGCVRVEDPVALAEWALKDQPQWTREKILEAMAGKPSLVVPLTRPIRVVLYYVTATVIPKDNAIHFADDIYVQDPVLDKALTARWSTTPAVTTKP